MLNKLSIKRPSTVNMKKIFLTLTLALASLPMLQAQTAREEIYENPLRAGGNYLAYLDPVKPLTKSPKGYEPFYISHYGRHGSRWLLSDWDYSNLIAILGKADRLGKLTAKGKQVLDDMQEFYPTTIGRLGDLTTVGERQHHQIGKRMTEHFPSVFKGTPYVDARSTVVLRCILSMTAECEEIMAYNPNTRMHNDVSESFQYYLNQGWSGEVARQGNNRARQEAVANAKRQYAHPDRFCSQLFNDSQYIRDSIDANSFMRHTFEMATNMQSHDTDIDFMDLFTKEEIYDLWKIKNIDWYLGYGAAPQTGGIMPFSQENLLKNILTTADTIVGKTDWNGATLRFGHEICVMPLACLLELDSCGRQVDDLATLDEKWVNYRIYPMGCNIQLVFYRPKSGKGDILMKALLNEAEATLPLPTDNFPYYKWTDFKHYFEKKLADFDEQYPNAQTRVQSKSQPKSQSKSQPKEKRRKK